MYEDSDLGTSSSLPVRVEIPGYRLRRECGSDSIGLWFDAEQESLGRKVTIKILKPKYEGHEAAQREFLAEMDRLAHLDHANLIRVIDSLRGDPLVLVTERIGSRTLATLLKEGKGLSEGVCFQLALGIARALDFLVRKGLAHKNVCPAMVAVRDDGSCRLITFRNVIPLEEQAGLKGKLAQDARYVAPEQIAGSAEIGSAAHVYQLGCLLYHMLAGRPPHEAGDVRELAKAHLKEGFPSLKKARPFMKEWIYSFVGACVQRAPEDRPFLEQVVAGLETLVDGKDPGIGPGSTGGPGRFVAPTPRRRRRRRR